MKTLLFTLLLWPSLIFATAQIPDQLLYESKQEEIFSTPLEQYFAQEGNRPEWLTMTNTACWRGYVASWEVRNGTLYLTEITRDEWDPDTQEVEYKDISKKIFPNASWPVKATWFSGSIQMPRGELIEYVHMGFASVYEQNLFLEFEDGVLQRVRIVNHTPSHMPRPKVRR